MEVGIYSHTIHCFRCPYCKQTCQVNNGDETDLTVCDEEDHKCEHCGKEFLLNLKESI